MTKNRRSIAPPLLLVVDGPDFKAEEDVMPLRISGDVGHPLLILTCDEPQCGARQTFDDPNYVLQRRTARQAGWREHHTSAGRLFRCPGCAATPIARRSKACLAPRAARLTLVPPGTKTAWKLNEFEKRMITRRYARGEPVREIAAAFDIAPHLVAHHAQNRGVPHRRPQHTKE